MIEPKAGAMRSQTLLEAILRSFHETFGDRFHQNEDLSRLTSARIGGPAEFLVEAENTNDLILAVKMAHASRLPWLILGGGSNILVHDSGVGGLVIHNRSRVVSFRHNGLHVIVRADSGVNIGSLARQCVARGLSGLEWAVSVPGTVGGAVFGNAGAHGGDIATSLRQATVMEGAGHVAIWPVETFQYGYRTSVLKRQPAAHRSYVVVAAEFALAPKPVEQLQALVDSYVEHRKTTQPPGASMGSMFKNPPADYAGRLIDAAGLKGRRIGQAEISELHANFFINLGGASAADVWTLIDLARQTVWEKFGVRLELEIELVGNWPERKVS